MRIQPDPEQAIGDQQAAVHLLRTVLTRMASHLAGGGDDSVVELVGALGSDVLSYPGFFAAAHDAQAAYRAGQPSPNERRRLAAVLREVSERACFSARRTQDCACPAWRADLAPPEPHLKESLARAKAQIPKTPQRADRLKKVSVGAWEDGQRAVFCATSCLLASIWPEMLAEVTAVVRQIALLRGYGIDGFTDFTCHGAVFVNERRFLPAGDGLPAEIHLAEALVHEAAHNRCNAAALSRPFLEGFGTSSGPLVMTPLRQDPRPLTGLFQQLVVLVRCLLLYDRLAGRAAPGGDAVGARREKLLHQARQGLETIQRHSAKLTEHGRDVVAEAESLLKQETAGTLA